MQSEGGICYKESGNWINGRGNIFSDESCGFDSERDMLSHHSQVGLGSLGYYGGRTPSLPLIKGSPAINFSSTRCEFPDGLFDAQIFWNPVNFDQREKPRDDGQCDAGAFERQAVEDEGLFEITFPIVFVWNIYK